MTLKINKKIGDSLISLVIIFGLALNMAVFVNVEVSFAQGTCDPKVQTCSDGSNKETTKTTPKKTGSKKTTTSPVEKAKTKFEEAEKANKEAGAKYDKQIAEKQKQLEGEKDPTKQAALQQEIKNIEGFKAKDPQVVKTSKALKTATGNYNKEKGSLKSKTEKAQAAFYKSNEKKVATEQKLAAKQQEISEAEAEMAKIDPEKDPGAAKALQDKITKLTKEEAALKKEAEKLKTETAAKEQDLKALQELGVKVADQAGANAAKTDEKLSGATVPFPYVASPSTSHSFNVDKYLTISSEHSAYFDGENSSAVNFAIRVINVMVRIIGSVAMLILILGGLILITAHGNEQQLEKGKDTIKYGLIGLTVALSSSLIIAFINNFLSVGTTG